MCPKDVRKVSLCLKRIGAQVKVKVRSPKVTQSRIFKITFKYRVTHVFGVVLDVEHDGGKNLEIWPPQNGEKVKKGVKNSKFSKFKILNSKHAIWCSFISGFQKCLLFCSTTPISTKNLSLKNEIGYFVTFCALYSNQILSYGLEILHADSSFDARGQLVSFFWKIQIFEKIKFFSKFGLTFWTPKTQYFENPR